jgi:hypothetical protein
VLSVRENHTSNGLPPYQNQCFPGAGIIAMRSLRTVVSRSRFLILARNFCSKNHSLTHTNAASSSVTVIIIVVWRTIQYQIFSGTLRSQTLRPPMIIKSRPPEANWFCPLSMFFNKSCIAFSF